MRVWLVTLAFAIASLLCGVASAAPTDSPPDAGANDAAITTKGGAGLGTAVDTSSAEGLPIGAIRVVSRDPTWKNVTLPTLTEVKVGEAFHPSVGRKALLEALSKGSFASGDVEVTATSEGVVLTISLVARKLVRNIRVQVAEGHAIDSDIILRDAGLVQGSELTASELLPMRERIETAIKRRGFKAPQVVLRSSEPGDATRVDIFVQMDPGSPLIISRRTFDVIRGDAQPATPIFEGYEVPVGAVGDAVRLDTADNELKGRLRAQRWFRAEVSHSLAEEHGVTTLRVEVALGPRYSMRFEGNEHYDADTLLAALNIAEDTDRSVAHLAEKIRVFYTARGFLDIEVDVAERQRALATTVSLVFKISEHGRVSVSRRTYPCLAPRELEGKNLEVAPSSTKDVGREIESFLEEELPGANLLRSPPAKGLDAVVTGPNVSGSRQEPVELNPSATYSPTAYARAAEHLQELYRADGYLSALVGPVQVIRKTCAKNSPPGRCLAEALPPVKEDQCNYDPHGIPLPTQPLDPTFTCVPDPQRGIQCAQDVTIRMPIKLGPQSFLSDALIIDSKFLSPKSLLATADLTFGAPVSTGRIEEARKRLVAAYQEEGFVYVNVRSQLELSGDQTRARVRFDVTEGERVFVESIVIHGNTRTAEGLIRKRVTLEVGEPYRTSQVRRTQELLALLGVFSNITVEIDNPFVPQKWKRVIVTVQERDPQVVDLGAGFSTGEGFRTSAEYGHRNLFGRAIGFSASVQASYLPSPLIFDQTTKSNFEDALGPNFGGNVTRIPARVTLGLQFPETGLGPLFRGGVDGLAVHDLQRDFYVRKVALGPSLTFAPSRKFRIRAGQTFEYSDVRLFNSDYETYLTNLRQGGDLSRVQSVVATVPKGENVASAQSLTITWDLRDQTLNPTRGTFLALNFEHVDSYPAESATTEQQSLTSRQTHIVRVSPVIGGYLPIYKGFRFAAQLRLGVNIPLTSTSQTRPDRYFFLGGVDSMRAWYPTTFVPQDDYDNDTSKNVVPKPVRGGNLMVNPRAEFRLPLYESLETVAFADLGNVWNDYRYPFRGGGFPMRVTIGSGIRYQTPVFPIALDIGFNPSRRVFRVRAEEEPTANQPVGKPAQYETEALYAINFSIGLF